MVVSCLEFNAGRSNGKNLPKPQLKVFKSHLKTLHTVVCFCPYKTTGTDVEEV